jgi:hypothetical protein
MLQAPQPVLRIAGRQIAIPPRDGTSASRRCVVAKRAGEWAYVDESADVRREGKRPGVQGPIDDAFTTKFLCVRGTGQPWNEPVQKWADAKLEEFALQWNRYFRGDLPIKNDIDVTEDDVRDSNLILFGDPGSNRWIAQVLAALPLSWSADEFEFRGVKYTAADHAPVCIQPNPLAANRYVVLNSGHTFGEKELSSLNYLLFPRLGDWAIFDIPSNQPTAAGFFNERWR